MANVIKQITESKIFTRGLILPITSDHSFSHWQRVEKIGLKIADQNGADKELISLFAYLHDARRETENTDNNHGKRALILLNELIKDKLINISGEKYQKLSYALANHTGDKVQSDDLTVRTCWDADRLDLWRVGKIPDPKRLFTDYGKTQEMRDFAKNLNHN